MQPRLIVGQNSWSLYGLTRNSLDCDQSNYSSRIVFSDIPFEFGQTGISAIRTIHSGDIAI